VVPPSPLERQVDVSNVAAFSLITDALRVMTGDVYSGRDSDIEPCRHSRGIVDPSFVIR